MPIKYSLPSSEKVLVENGNVNESVLLSLIKEAYDEEGLYAECHIKRKMENGEFSYIPYKELWDGLRSLTGREEFHPYDNKKHPFSLGSAFALKKRYEEEMDFLDATSQVSVGDFSRGKIPFSWLEAESLFVEPKEDAKYFSGHQKMVKRKPGGSKKVNDVSRGIEQSGKNLIRKVSIDFKEDTKKKNKLGKKRNSDVYYYGHGFAPRNNNRFE